MSLHLPTPSAADIETALVAFLAGVLADGMEVIKGQINRVAEPQGSDYVVFWPRSRARLATNASAYDDDAQTNAPMQETEVVYQLDVHGPNSTDNAQVITTLWRDNYGVESFGGAGSSIAPLHADEPKQVPFVNAEQQYEDRWVIEAHLQANQTVTVPQPQAEATSIVTIEVDALPP